MFETVCALISLIYITLAICRTAISLSTKDKHKRCARIKNYKKGTFIATYLAAFPLYLAAYQAKGFIWMILDSISATLRVAVLTFDVASLNAVAAKSGIFKIAFFSCVVLTVANTMLLSLSLFFREISCKRSLKRIKGGEHDVIVLVGYGKRNKSILSSLKRDTPAPLFSRPETDVIILADALTPELKEEAYIHAAAYLPLTADIEKLILDTCPHFDKRHVTLIIETEDHERNLKYAYQAASLADSLGEQVASAYNETRTGLDTYVFTDESHESVYGRIIHRSRGSLHARSIHKLIAQDFVAEHPLTSFIPDKIDTERALIKSGTEVRILFIGFGKLSREIFYTAVQDNQLPEEYTDPETGKAFVDGADIRYYVFDKNGASGDADYNHNYNRYSRWLAEERSYDDYYELPKKPCEPIFEQVAVGDGGYFTRIKAALSSGEGAYNVVIISESDDLAALDLTEKITDAVKEADCAQNTTMLVRIRSAALASEAKTRFTGEIPFIPFGTSTDYYTYEKTVADGIEGIAMYRHLSYALEQPRDGETEEETKRRAINKWLFEWSAVQRDSNVYACLTLRSRFNLLGYDITDGDPKDGDDSESFLRDYQRGNEIKYLDKTVGGKRLVDYSDRSYRVSGSVRERLAIFEHLRWNAYYVASGYVPASKTEHETLSKTQLNLRRLHINLTTDKGLSEYEKRCVELGSTPADADILKYDYQLMDDAVWLLHRSGKLIKKQNNDDKEARR